MAKIHRVIVKPIGKDRFELFEPYAYKGLIVVPQGYITNGADIPRLLWSIFPPNSPEYLSAVIVHDYMTDLAEHDLYNITFKRADEVFYELMIDIGVSKWKAKLFYLGCRAWHILTRGING